MLKTRTLTAVIALILFLSALFYLSPIFWMAVLLTLVLTGAVEWSKLGKFSATHSTIYLMLTVLLGGELLYILSRAVLIDPYTTSFLWLYAASLLFWMIAAPALLKSNYPIKSPLLMCIIGWLLLLPTGLALYQLRAISPLLLLGFMAAIWISDTAAYFAGRAYGKHKLAPGISPGKTWEGWQVHWWQSLSMRLSGARWLERKPGSYCYCHYCLALSFWESSAICLNH